jgi:branched-chain amino acid transport system permease protein
MPARRFPVAAALKDAVLAALVALGLFALMIGLYTVPGPTGQLVATTRLQSLAIIVGVVFAGAFVRALLFGREPIAPNLRLPAPLLALKERIAPALGTILVPALLGFALLAPALFYNDRYLLDLSILVLTYVMLGWGLNIVVGFAGLLDLGYVAFYAVGAYSYALLAQHFELSFWICLPLAGILAAFWGILLGFPVLRLRGDYLAIVTMAFGEIIRLVLLNWQSFTGGPNGISSIPRPSFFGIPFNNEENGFAATFGL